MKIFLSYGHNDHVNLVNAVFDALTQAGHTPWKDDRYEGNSGIAPGEDFVQVIYDAIDNSDFVIAFVTASTIEKRFCCDERQYAYNKKGTRYIQIRLDNTEIKLGNSLSYIDMDEAEETTGKINQTLFDEKMRAVFAAFRDPASFAEGGFTPWSKFEAHLKVEGVMKYKEFLAMPEKQDFVGREWLCEKCKSWVMDDSIACRLFVVLGEAGSGKTAFVRHLATDYSLVKSVHVCIYDRPSTRTARDTLRDLAYILAENNDAYFNFLKNKSFDKLVDMSIDGLFEFLFLEPLKNETEKYLLVIDGLDELDEENGLTPLFKVFRQYATRINPNISFLLTGRPDENILNKLSTVEGYKPLGQVVLDKQTSEEDLSKYIEAKLTELDCYSESLAKELLDSCDGNFEYLALTFKEAREEGFKLAEKMQMPDGLNARYTQYIDRRLESKGQVNRLTREQRLLLSVICAAYEPMSLSLLAAITDMDDFDVLDELSIFGSLIRKNEASTRDVYISLFTKSLKDYLVGFADLNYRISVDKGNNAIIDFIFDRCNNIRKFSKYPYIKENGFRHLMEYAKDEPDEVKGFIDLLWEADRDMVSQKIAFALNKADTETAEVFCEMCIGQYYLYKGVTDSLKQHRDKDTMAKIVSALENIGQRDTAWVMQGDILKMDPTPEATARAREFFLSAYEVRERNYINNPCAQTSNDLAVVCDRLGVDAMNQKTPKGLLEAENWFKKLYELGEKVYAENPCYDCRKDLALICRRIGDVEKRKSTPASLAAAQEWYKKAIVLDEQNISEKPCYVSRWAVAIDCERLGAVCEIQCTPESLAQAESYFERSCRLKEQNYLENPCYESRNALSIVYERLGDVEKRKATPESLAKAEQWYHKDLELGEQNYRENPCYQSRKSLSIIYDKLTDVAEGKSTPAGMAEAEAWCLKMCELDEQNYRENPCYDSRLNLAVTYGRLGDIEEEKSTPEGLAKAEEWYKKECEFKGKNYQENPCYSSRKSLSITYERLGFVNLEQGTAESVAEAELWFKKGCELDEENYRVNPCNESRRSLAITYINLGDLARAKGTLEGLEMAEGWYKKSCELDEQSHRENPCYNSRKGLAVAYTRLADLERRKNTQQSLLKASEWYNKIRELNEQSYRENPCYSTRSDLAIVYERLGIMEEQKGTAEALANAEEWYHKDRELCEQNYEENPCFNSRYSLAIVYSNLGDVCFKMGTDEATAQAEAWYRKSYELLDQNYAENPSQESRNSLSEICKTIADFEISKNTPESMARAGEWYQKSYRLDEYSYKLNPSCSNAKHLASVCKGIADVAKVQNTEEGLTEAKEWYIRANEFFEISYKLNPSSENRRSLALSYSWIEDLLKAQKTPEALAEAEFYSLKRKKLGV